MTKFGNSDAAKYLEDVVDQYGTNVRRKVSSELAHFGHILNEVSVIKDHSIRRMVISNLSVESTKEYPDERIYTLLKNVKTARKRKTLAT